MGLRILLCEPYFAGSHRSWAQGLATHSRHDVRLITHAGGFWKWRMQGAALTLGEQIAEAVKTWGPPDVLLVSDMVHLPALLGFARRCLADAAVVLYMHENQLTYPVRTGAVPDETYAMTNWLSMSIADRVVFNSEHHRRELLSAVPGFLRRFPDHRHTHAIDDVAGVTAVLPVGIDLDRFGGSRGVNETPVILWNHRWEYDKQPEVFFRALSDLAARGMEFAVIVAGEKYQTVPDAFERGRRDLGKRILHFGTATEEGYPRLLASADIVVSTARHEFFGIAVLEAMAAGVLPVLPARLSYPELVPAPTPFLYGDDDELVERLAWALTHPVERHLAAGQAREHARRFAWPLVAEAYDALLVDAARRRAPVV